MLHIYTRSFSVSRALSAQQQRFLRAFSTSSSGTQSRVDLWHQFQQDLAASQGRTESPVAGNIRIRFNGHVQEVEAGALRPLDLFSAEPGLVNNDGSTILGARVCPLRSWTSSSTSSPENVVCSVKELFDPFTEDCEVVSPLTFSHAQGKEVAWHSSAHLLGAAMEAHFGNDLWLCDGPAVLLKSDGIVPAGSGGFFYEGELRNGQALTADVIKTLRGSMQQMVKRNLPFEWMVLSVDQARMMFGENPHKMDLLRKVEARGEAVKVYKVGNFVDLCRGPHVPHAGCLGKMHLLDTGASHDQATGALLHRVYGTSFPTKEELKDWQDRTAEAAKRDHRMIGSKQQLFMFSDYSPGSAFMLPHGSVVFNRLMQLLREMYERYGYDEVSSPLIYADELWQVSGHSDNYAEHMYAVKGMEDEEGPRMGLKPMNCPGHCLIYAHALRSYRDLPLRVADFSALHRNEFTGALGGMTRLRRFHQDDAHIFCTEDQVEEEIAQCLAFVQEIYSMFGFQFSTRCSTQPEKSIGETSEWQKAELALEAALRRVGMEWERDEGEGAFYGPKIDIAITDALGREHQCATIQLDFQLPQRFQLKYKCANGEYDRPVMIHRAIFGSFERFMAILVEHTAGKWPFWLSPRQVMILPVDHVSDASYAHAVAKRLERISSLDKSGNEWGEGEGENKQERMSRCVDVDATFNSLGKRLRAAQQAPFNLICVVGEKEREAGLVAIRSNDGTVQKQVSIEALVDACTYAVETRAKEAFPEKLV